MRRAVGALLLLVSSGVAAVGVLWAIFKTTGTEWDICTDDDCTCGYAYAIPLIVVGVVGVGVGLRLLRRPGSATGQVDPPTGP